MLPRGQDIFVLFSKRKRRKRLKVFRNFRPDLGVIPTAVNFVSDAMAALDFTIPLERDLHEITLYFLAVRVIDLRKGSSYSFLILPGVPGGNLEDRHFAC